MHRQQPSLVSKISQPVDLRRALDDSLLLKYCCLPEFTVYYTSATNGDTRIPCRVTEGGEQEGGEEEELVVQSREPDGY